ncbi:polyprenyl synthetase family protein [Nitrospina gracilis]|uniref:polyprenyl synthetase family protein n=1 Tax=Nitrospina gracilis TaxID=35801 RepID=UPI001F3F7EB6|nr:polyprenyl synthetase family protein [Nitrospina gracilis]MCF8721053.1 octaprenyl-diphosphate synthase [Nitrospina gracilis Nb-211]
MGFREVTEFFREDLLKVEQCLRDNFESSLPIVTDIGDYILNAGGKRIRPLLLLLSSRLCGLPSNDRVIKHCCVIEYIHAATLLHDDVVDETTVRRGNETVNSKWGSDASILVGDFMIARALILLSDDIQADIFRAFGQGSKLLVEGGLLEYSNARDILVTEDHILEVAHKKTASIMALSCQIGALLAEAGKSNEEAMIDFGNNFGIAFQLMDDAMDYDAPPEVLGKPQGTDFKEGHVTLPLLHLYQHSDNGLRREIEEFIQNGNLTHKEFDYILERMRETKSLEYTMNKARAHMDEAKKILFSLKFPCPEYLELMATLSDHIIDRYTPSNISLTPIS